MFHTIDGRRPDVLDMTLAAIGIPPWDVLGGRAGWERRFYELSGDRAPVLGSLESLIMNELDIDSWPSEDLPDGIFPGGRNEAFRVYFSPEVHAALWKHAGEDTSVEICGVLVGTWHRDPVGPFAKVVESIRGEGATTKFAEVTFTHQTWAKINAEMDTKFADMKIVGWYHTHPDFGIFLSDRDRFIQEHFFSGPGQVAHVIDPVRRVEGVFIWRGGKPALAEHFWVGDRILTASDAEKPASPAGPGRGGGASASAGPRPG